MRSKWEYILFRDVEHCGTSSASGISSIRFRNSGNWVPTDLDGIPLNSKIGRNFGNSTQFRNFLHWIFVAPLPSCRLLCFIVIDFDHDAIPELDGTEWNSVPPSPSFRLLCLTVNHFDHDLIPERNSGNWVKTELDGIPADFGVGGTDSGMYNIAE